MQYNININQKALLDLSTKTDVKLGLKHACLIDFFTKFRNSNKAKTMIFEGNEYIWVSYGLILENLPLLEIKSKDVLARYFNDLIKAKILTKVTSKKMGNKTYWRQGENFGCLFFDTLPTFQSEPSDDLVDTLPTFQSVYNIHKDNINNNYSENPKIEKKLNEVMELTNLSGTPYEFLTINKIKEKIPSEDLEDYLTYLINQIKLNTQKYLSKAYTAPAFYDWWYKDFLGQRNLNKKNETKETIKEIKKSDYKDENQFLAELEMLKSLNIKFNII